MKLRDLNIFSLFLLFTLISCSDRVVDNYPGTSGKIAVLSLYDNLENRIPGRQVPELQRVMSWMENDLLNQLWDENLEISFLEEIADYSSAMGPLIIVIAEAFTAGSAGGIPNGEPGSGPSFLEINYRILDTRGALVAEWQDAAQSRRGGTYCARSLNRRALQKLTATLQH